MWKLFDFSNTVKFKDKTQNIITSILLGHWITWDLSKIEKYSPETSKRNIDLDQIQSKLPEIVQLKTNSIGIWRNRNGAEKQKVNHIVSLRSFIIRSAIFNFTHLMYDCVIPV